MLSEPGRYGDGGTLFLNVAPGGSKSWIQRLTINGKRHDIGLGGYSLVTLAEAREQAFENRRLARRRGDPLAAKRRSNVPSFEQAAVRTFEVNRPRWRDGKTATNWIGAMARYAFPIIGCLGAQLAISVNNCPPPRDPRSRMTSVKRTQRKYVQKAYRVRNWREYETGLRARGSLTVWLGLTDGKLANWNSPRPTRRTPGRQRQYSHHAIETTVTLGLVFGLASRQTEGFLRSLLT